MSGQTTSSKDKEDPQNLNSTASPKDDDDTARDEPEVVKFSPEDEAELLAESNTHKTEANALFNGGSYTEALAKYSDATDSCPNYLDFELAVLHSNISACHLKLQEWKDAISSATAALDKLQRLDAQLTLEEEAEEQEKAGAEPAAEKKKKQRATKQQQQQQAEEDEGVEEEIVSAGAAKSAPAAPADSNHHQKEDEEKNDPVALARARRRADIRRIRYKALMRRARARSEAGGWSNLAGAEEDYKTLITTLDNILTPSDRRLVAAQLRTLPPRVNEAKERETAEMWGKLKELGNGILKPFGLNTDSFQMTQDPNTGGYSMNFKSG